MNVMDRLLVGAVFILCQLMAAGSVAQACGGFFCKLIPVEQAAEQIVFRQDGDLTTLMIQIQYSGAADDFGWVIPVPATPTIEIGSNTLFTDLEIVTRPVFNLETTDNSCVAPAPQEPLPASAVIAADAPDPGDVDILVEQSLQLGPYNAQIINSDNGESLNSWLVENGYTVSGDATQLIDAYVQEGMKFVGLKLRNDRDAGSIVPIILKYRSEQPVIPIRLTRVASTDDLGVTVWLVGDARAVPQNYLHVVPNYTRLNWFAGSRSAYASYQELITEAMNEAGGQGFATDFAGIIEDLADQLISPTQFEDRLRDLQELPNADYLSLIQENFFDAVVRDTILALLPLPDGQTESIFFSAQALELTYTAEQLQTARREVDRIIREEIIQPLRNSRELIDENRYLTRLYTTLSADEMTLDPAFVFNPDMPAQPLERSAMLQASCIDQTTQWSLTLGDGTGRAGELVVQGAGSLPAASLTLAQQASWKLETTFASGLPVTNTERDFPLVGIDIDVQQPGSGGGGGVALGWLISLLLFSVLPRPGRAERPAAGH